MLKQILIFVAGLIAGVILRPVSHRPAANACILTLNVDTVFKTIERPREVAVRLMGETVTVVRRDTLVRMVREERTYTDSSSYMAVVSGYDARLDTLRFLNAVTTNMVRTGGRSRRHFGVGVTGGLGISPRGVAPSVTIGLTYMF